MKIKLILSFALIAIWGPLFSQTLVVTDDPVYTTGHASSVLDVKSVLKGFLAPRMLQSERLAISSPTDGLLVYQTDGIKGFYYFDGSIWLEYPEIIMDIPLKSINMAAEPTVCLILV